MSLLPSNIATWLLPVLCVAAEVERVTVIASLDSDKESPAPGRGRGNILK